jgi:hypothetical protein
LNADRAPQLKAIVVLLLVGSESIILMSQRMISLTKPLLAIIISLTALITVAKPQMKKPSGLFSILQNGKVGFIDRTGKIVIQPQFEHVNDFS